ncbi:N-acetyltransferase [Roseomonas sp. OT10]|uniref:GNAT family N-acetyltransferase n=1 Tax=Roseomonas cutis TaxID=2897332 RepID=UPI001E28FE28|nr:N-acetyltransferase [Roseomonas sp. OT10]UFN47264.1 N-acetyltransferase [Roseomonas sp. OT10]
MGTTTTASEATLRDERQEDAAAIAVLVAAAFDGAPHASGAEAALVGALRRAGALTLSLVAESGGALVGLLVGHVAFSPVRIGGAASNWHGLGPVAVRPDRQRGGIGTALVRAGLERLRALGSGGCVVLGDPGFYGRLGFRPDPRLWLEGVPPEYFQALAFSAGTPEGAVTYHPAFDATAPEREPPPR